MTPFLHSCILFFIPLMAPTSFLHGCLFILFYFLFFSFLLLVSHICVPVCIYGLLEPENIQSRRDGGVSVLFLLCLLAPHEIM